MGVIISTLLIQFYGWTGFDPIASLFIAILIAASVIPLVIDSGEVLCLDVADRECTITHALEEVCLDRLFFSLNACDKHRCSLSFLPSLLPHSPLYSLYPLNTALNNRRPSVLLLSTFLAKRLLKPHRLHPHSTRTFPSICRPLRTPFIC